jgi:hypothetical protein
MDRQNMDINSFTHLKTAPKNLKETLPVSLIEGECFSFLIALYVH